MRYPTRFQQKTVWSAVTGVAILTLGALICGAIWLIGEVFGFLQVVLIPLVVAAIVAYVLDPVVRLLETRGLSRLWSVVVVFIALLTGATLLTAAVLPGIQKGRAMIHNAIASSSAVPPAIAADAETVEVPAPDDTAHLIPALARSLHDLRERHKGNPIGWALTEVTDDGEPIAHPNGARPDPESLDYFSRTRAGRMIHENMDEILRTGREWLTAGSTKILGFAALTLGMIMVPVYLFFFLKDSAAIRLHWHDYVPLRASRFKTELVSTLQEINGYLVSFFRGQVLVAAIDGLLVGIALELYNLPYGFLIGIFMAILGVIPYIGNILCLIPACIIGYLHAQEAAPFGLAPWPYVGGLIVIFFLVQQINSLVTAPKIVGDSVGLHPLTVIFSMLFWSIMLGGFVGALLAVPLSAAVKVLFRRYIWERQLREGPEPA
jgi:predicted PurR-regulated permease PerM